MRDLREFLKTLEEAGSLNVIEKEIHWNQQAACICAMSQRVWGGAVHFKRIKGYPEGYSLAGGILAGSPMMTHLPIKIKAWSRIALSMELSPDVSYEELQSVLIERKRETLSPIRVASGPSQEEVHMASDIDILEFPFPLIHESDRGRYGTFHNLIVKEMDGEYQDWSSTRFLILSPSELVGSFLPVEPSLLPIRGDYTHRIYQQYEKRGEAMPFAIAIGGPPTNYLASMTYTPYGIYKPDLAGGYGLDPLEVVRAKTSELLVPAHAEIIIEGEVLPRQRREEGPFGEFTIGYSKPSMQPLFKLKCITHRKDPILPFVAEGTMGCDSYIALSLTASSSIFEVLKFMRGWPVKWVALPPEMGLVTCIVATSQPYGGYPTHLARTVFSSHFADMIDKLIVVSDEIPAYDMVSVLLDFGEKVNPAYDVHILDQGCKISPLVAYDREGEELKTSAKVVFDALWPWGTKPEDIPVRLAFEACIPKVIQERVINRWAEYGLSDLKPYWKKEYIK